MWRSRRVVRPMQSTPRRRAPLVSRIEAAGTPRSSRVDWESTGVPIATKNRAPRARAGVTADGRMTSHWTVGGEPLPYVPFIAGWEPAAEPPAFVDFYRQCRERFRDQITAASVPVERIGDVILVVGEDDRVWPS